MKRMISLLSALGLLAALATGCKEEYTTYGDAEYVMFADSVSLNMVQEHQDYFAVPVSATTACDYDRTFGVEVIDAGSTAIEGLHYRLKSNTVTIPAGQLSTDVLVHGIYDNLEGADTLQFNLRLVMPGQLNWNLYNDRTRVRILKSCTFHVEDFTGWCMVTSTFLQNYPGVENSSIQRLVYTERDANDPNTVILYHWLFSGHHIRMTFDPSNPAEPVVTLPGEQTMGNELTVFGQIRGDNKIRVVESPLYDSFFDACAAHPTVRLWSHVYVLDMASTVGTVGHFYNLMEWISDEESDRLVREEGITRYGEEFRK